MEITVDGKVWTVLKVYEKKQREKDVFLCENKYHIKECFQRCDFELREGAYVPRWRRKATLSEEDKLKIEEWVRKKKSRRAICQMFNNVPTNRVIDEIAKARKKFGYTYKDNSRGGKIGRAVLQYDLDGNFIRRYDSCYAAAQAVGINEKSLWYSLNDRRTPKDFIWRYEDDQFKREG